MTGFDHAAKREFVLLASYCGNDNPSCSGRRPCPICLGMSNVFKIGPSGEIEYLRQLAPEWNTNSEVTPPWEVAEEIARGIEPKPRPMGANTSERRRALEWAAQVARSMFKRPE